MSVSVFWIIAAAVFILLFIGLLFRVLFKLFIRLIPIALIVLVVWWLIAYGPVRC
jgi:hypothetical protein